MAADRAARCRDAIYALLPNRPAGPEHQNDRHDDENHHAGGLGPVYAGDAFTQAEQEAGDNGSQNRPHAAYDHHGKDDDNQMRPHDRVDRIDRRRQHAGKRSQGHAETVGQRHEQADIHTEGADEIGIFGRRTHQRPQLGTFNDQPGDQTHHHRSQDHPAAIERQEHESQIGPPRQGLRNAVRLARDAVDLAKTAFQNQGQAKGEQQPVEVIKVVEMAQEQAFDDDPEHPDDEGSEDERGPIADPDILQQQPGHESPQHVEGAVGKIDDVQQPEDQRQAQAEHGIEGPID